MSVYLCDYFSEKCCRPTMPSPLGGWQDGEATRFATLYIIYSTSGRAPMAVICLIHVSEIINSLNLINIDKKNEPKTT